MANQLCNDSNNQLLKLTKNNQTQYTSDYVTVALWKGFDIANGLEIANWYKIPDDQHGVSYGTYKLKLSSTTETKRSLIEKEHRQFISDLAQHDNMLQLVDLWQEVSTLQA